MKTKYIKITNLNDLSKFILEASKVNGDVLVHRGKFCVDGKSLMGMVFINVAEGCRIEYPEDEKEFEEYITKFESTLVF